MEMRFDVCSDAAAKSPDLFYISWVVLKIVQMDKNLVFPTDEQSLKIGVEGLLPIRKLV